MWLAGFVSPRAARPDKPKKRGIKRQRHSGATPSPATTDSGDDDLQIEGDDEPSGGGDGMDLVEFHDEDLQAAADDADAVVPTNDFESRLGRLGHHRR
jgi:hypothetical protein